MGNGSSPLQMMFLLDFLLLVAVVLLQQISESIGQQAYINNKQLDCEKNYSNTGGYVCNGALSSCRSYLTFRSTPLYNSAATIGYLLSTDASEIARINNISDVDIVPTDTLLIVPANCSCFSTSSSAATATNSSSTSYYQHNASYILKTASETYFSVANNTYEGLTTCQSLIAQNPYNYRSLTVGMKLSIPLRCACPTSYQTDAGVRYLLTYLVTWRDTVIQIADTFGVDNQSVFYANELSSNTLIFPFTPILVPLKTEPPKINTPTTPPPPPPPPTIPVRNQSSSSRKWVFMGAGIGGVVLFIVAFSGFLFWFFRRSRRPYPYGEPVPDTHTKGTKAAESVDYTAVSVDSKSWSVSSEGVRYAIGYLTVYKLEELQKATGFFGEANRIKGSSVYRGSFKGDEAAVKVMKGDVSAEINILKQINHSSIIRLSGLCVHDGNTYLVYEYAENGSLSDWLHSKKSTRTRYSSTSLSLGWKQRVQIAYDIADALNYLHNYASPPYIHKNLKSSNILLDGDLRAKLANFGLARTLPKNQDLQLTRHVVGTHGYLAPEYIENGLITPKLDVYAFGVVMLELLSGREATTGGHLDNKKKDEDEEEEELLSATISPVLGGENVREKLRGFIDPSLGDKYPLDLAYSLAQLANDCVARGDLNSRPVISEVFMTLSKILSSSMDWDASDELNHSISQSPQADYKYTPNS
ncbi:hypothetical protein U1Q18_015964 [Sarracenia purpurea var. burkii]